MTRTRRRPPAAVHPPARDHERFRPDDLEPELRRGTAR
jgi:hypothetical protein